MVPVKVGRYILNPYLVAVIDLGASDADPVMLAAEVPCWVAPTGTPPPGWTGPAWPSTGPVLVLAGDDARAFRKHIQDLVSSGDVRVAVAPPAKPAVAPPPAKATA
jgi:hypothetical protein